MSPLDRVRDPFQLNYEQAQRSAKEQLKFIMTRASTLQRLRGGATKLKAAQDFQRIVTSGAMLTPNQMSYVDAIYEATWKAMGVSSVNGHSDKFPH
jgi:hypothetical protein